MMNERRAKLIAEVVKHLEALDGEELGSMMKPEKPEGEMAVEIEVEPKEEGEMSGKKGPMEELLGKKVDAPKMEDGDEEMSDEDFEERLKL